AAQPRALAIRARQVAAIAAEKHSDVHLVFLALEPAEESADAVVPFAAFDDEMRLPIGELCPGHVLPDACFACSALQLGELRSVMRLAPRFDRVLRDRLGPIRH